MKSKWALGLLVVVVAGATYAGTVLATPPAGVVGTTYGIGKFGPIDTKGTFGGWNASMKTSKPTEMYVLSNRIAPGGNFGWHSHPGPSFVLIKSGTATVYLGADPTCKPRRYPAGTGFVDRGLDVHMVRNEGLTDLVTVVVSFVPPGKERRIDEARPGNCSF